MSFGLFFIKDISSLLHFMPLTYELVSFSIVSRFENVIFL